MGKADAAKHAAESDCSLENRTEGKILLNGKEVKAPGSERTVMFQEHALFPWLNVIQNIKFGMEINGVPKKEQD